jgi:cysteinyl-tRNA synthetase
MSSTYLGAHFDIHGGGADLMFPHHENEIAQSRCADPEHNHFANYWVHNGFLTVDGEKMSKSLGNFITVHDLLEKGMQGEVIRFALLSAKYNEPLDWNEKLLSDAKLTLDKWYRATASATAKALPAEFIAALSDDLNLPKAFSLMHAADAGTLLAMAHALGFLHSNAEEWFKGAGKDNNDIDVQVQARIEAKKSKNWAEADRIRKELAGVGIVLEDRPDGTTDWRRA